jgi:perosamine synthetase
MIRFSTFGPYIDKNDIAIVSKAILLKNWYKKPYYYCEKLEKLFAKFHNRRFALLTPNCTSAIHLFLHSLNLKNKDEVIAPECTWIASISPVYQTKAKLILCDIDRKNFCISVEDLKKRITKNTKVIISVNLYGNMANYNELEKICKKKKIFLLEDAAESLGSTYYKKKSGSFGTASVFSFHRTKTMTTGEGGMLLLNDEKIYKRCRLLRDHGRGPNTKDLFNEEFSFKYMPSNMQAALGYSQFKKLSLLLKKKRTIFNYYKYYLKDIKDKIYLNEDNVIVKNGCWAIILVLKDYDSNIIKKIFISLKSKKYFPRPLFYPISLLPAYKKKKVVPKKKNINAYETYKGGMVLPSSYLLKKNDIKKISKIIKDKL